MFWQVTSYRSSSSINAMLAKENITLENILDEDDIIQEAKAQNQQLAEFLVKPECIKQLVLLSTKDPSEEMDENLRFKYPHIACELLCSGLPILSDTLLEYFEELVLFLDQDRTLNPLLTSFNCKVLSNLLRIKSQEFINMIKLSDQFINGLVKHIGTSSCCDLLLQLISYGDTVKDFQIWLYDHELIDSLCDLINPTVPIDKCQNASQALIDILRMGKEISSVENTDTSSILQDTIESESFVRKIFSNMLNCSDGPSKRNCFRCGISLLQALLEPVKTPEQLFLSDLNLPLNLSSGISGLNYHDAQSYEPPKITQGGANALKVISENFESIRNILMDNDINYIFKFQIENNKQLLVASSINSNADSSIVNKIETSTSTHITTNIITNNGNNDYDTDIAKKDGAIPTSKPTDNNVIASCTHLGNKRLSTIKLINSLLVHSTLAIHISLIQSGIIPVLFELFVQFPFNNFLHSQIEQIIKVLLFPSPSIKEASRIVKNEDESDNSENSNDELDSDSTINNQHREVIDLLLRESNIIQFIVRGWLENRNSIKNSNRRKGYMGHLTLVTNSILHQLKDPNTKQKFDEAIVSEELINDWNSIINNDLVDINQKNSFDLVFNKQRCPSRSSSDTEEYNQQDPDLIKGYLEYQIFQVSTHFDEKIGLDNETSHSEDYIAAPYSQLDDIKFSVLADEDKSTIEVFEKICGEKIIPINYFNNGECYDSPRSTDTEDFIERAIISDCHAIINDNSGESDDSSNEDDPEDMSPVLAPRIISQNSLGNHNDNIKLMPPSHIVYRESTTITNDKSNSLHSFSDNDFLHNDDSNINLSIGQETNNDWSDYGPFSDIASTVKVEGIVLEDMEVILEDIDLVIEDKKPNEEDIDITDMQINLHVDPNATMVTTNDDTNHGNRKDNIIVTNFVNSNNSNNYNNNNNNSDDDDETMNIIPFDPSFDILPVPTYDNNKLSKLLASTKRGFYHSIEIFDADDEVSDEEDNFRFLTSLNLIKTTAEDFIQDSTNIADTYSEFLSDYKPMQQPDNSANTNSASNIQNNSNNNNNSSNNNNNNNNNSSNNNNYYNYYNNSNADIDIDARHTASHKLLQSVKNMAAVEEAKNSALAAADNYVYTTTKDEYL